jgi:hypothetical protein
VHSAANGQAVDAIIGVSPWVIPIGLISCGSSSSCGQEASKRIDQQRQRVHEGVHQSGALAYLGWCFNVKQAKRVAAAGTKRPHRRNITSIALLLGRRSGR